MIDPEPRLFLREREQAWSDTHAGASVAARRVAMERISDQTLRTARPRS